MSSTKKQIPAEEYPVQPDILIEHYVYRIMYVRYVLLFFSPICLHALALCWLFSRDHTIPLNHFMTVVPNDVMSSTVSSSGNPFYKGPFYMRTCVILELRGTHLIATEEAVSTPQHFF